MATHNHSKKVSGPSDLCTHQTHGNDSETILRIANETGRNARRKELRSHRRSVKRILNDMRLTLDNEPAAL